MATVSEAWKAIVSWLEANVPDSVELLQGPVAESDLADAEAKTGLTFPADLKELFLTCNGTDANQKSIGLFPSADDFDELAYGPLELKQALSEWGIQKELLEGGDFEGEEADSDAGVADAWWHTGWFPFGSNGGGDLYCVDTAPTEGGTVGQVITHSHESGEHRILAPSLSAWLSELAEGLAAGKFKYDEMWGMTPAD